MDEMMQSKYDINEKMYDNDEMYDKDEYSNNDDAIEDEKDDSGKD